MTVVLDSGGVSALATDRARLQALRERDEWPPIVPSVVLTEALTGDYRRDFHADRLVRLCDMVVVDELLARRGASLRTAAAPSDASAVDAVVVGAADDAGGAVVLTSDPIDLRALAAHTHHTVRVETV